MLNRMLTIEVARVTEAAAIAAAGWRGRGDERQADHAALEAMRRALESVAAMDGLAILGDEQKASILYIGDGTNEEAPRIEVALAPLEGATLCAKSMPDAISCIALAEGGSLLHAPTVYMDKIAIGGGYPKGVVDLDLPPEENILSLARARNIAPTRLTACILDRPRHAELIAAVRRTGASVRLISDGDVAGVIHTADPEETGIDIYLGIGGAPEGVLAAAALRCIGGQMQARLLADRARPGGKRSTERKYDLDDLASGDIMFAATGVTDGSLLDGVRFETGETLTETVVMRSSTGTVRSIKTRRKNGAIVKPERRSPPPGGRGAPSGARQTGISKTSG
jgi:fructose-1,6-bisphosphatase II / sedoheptulose-1,7-bisphosphatase